MKENKKEMNQKSKKVILIVAIVLVILLAIFLIFKFFDFRQTSNGELNNGSGEVIDSDENIDSGEISEEKYWDESLEIENYFGDEIDEEVKINEEIIPYSGEKIEEAVFEIDGIKISNFKVESLEGSTNITGEIENQLDKRINSVALSIKLYNSNKEILYDYSMVVSDIEAKEKRNVQTNIGTTFTGLENIYVEASELDIEE